MKASVSDGLAALALIAGAVMAGEATAAALTNQLIRQDKVNVLVADSGSVIWPKHLADFLTDEAAKAGLTRVAILYATNDFTGTQASALKGFVEASRSRVKIAFYKGVPSTTSDDTVMINSIAATHPDIVVQLGYVGNDIALLRNLQDSGLVIYPPEDADGQAVFGPK